jgi:transcriptional regulator with PAS, ATPase and Fis domain
MKTKTLCIALIFIALCSSCRSKKKIVEKSSELVKRDLVTSSLEIETTDFKIKTETRKASETFTVSKNDVLELIQADPNKSITITNANGQTMSIKGANVKISNTAKTSIARDSLNNEITSTGNKTKTTKENTSLNESIKKKKRNTDSDVKTTSTWFWLLLIIIALSYVAYRYKIF